MSRLGIDSAGNVSQVADALQTPYGLSDFERDVTSMKPRFVDIWVIPPLMMYAAWASSAKRYGGRGPGLNRWARRALFTAGVYMMYRNFSEYKASITTLTAIAKGQSNVTT
jgi:hypothetical protein